MARPRGSRTDRTWSDALRKASLEYHEGKAGPKKIEMMARKLIDAVLAGDVSAAKEYGDRIEGKPLQTIDATINDERMVVEAPQPAESAVDWQQSYNGKPN